LDAVIAEVDLIIRPLNVFQIFRQDVKGPFEIPEVPDEDATDISSMTR